MATIDDFRKAAERVRNWGRWGAEDQLGTLNFITPEKLRQAGSLVRQGKLFALGTSFDAYGPQGAHGVRRNPIHLMVVDGGDADAARYLEGWGGETEAAYVRLTGVGPVRYNDDYIIMPLQCATQWDALAHIYYDGFMYNGVPAAAVTSLGATRNSIDQVDVKGISSRGVLLDVARHRGVPVIPPTEVIPPEELDEVARAQKVEITSGDIILVRTGWWGSFLQDRNVLGAGYPGLSWRCAEWLHRNEVAAVAADNIAVEGRRPEIEGVPLALHMLCLRDMGMMFGEIWNLEALGQDCAADGVYEFLLVAPPLRVTGAVGSPINPIAMK